MEEGTPVDHVKWTEARVTFFGELKIIKKRMY
jgi:hypothetical protein